jgi:3-deoxy-D-manno-octulosonate 8-phosphate phosphatase (KDO 8-P phosphatase)
MTSDRFFAVDLFAFDIDGTLTDGTTTWLGPEVGWTQTYSIRDGEAILRLKRLGLPVMPLSRNRTRCARTRMEALGVPLEWLGVEDKVAALDGIVAAHRVPLDRICFAGDGLEDAAVFARVGCPCAVADAHPRALAAAAHVTVAKGGQRAIEELSERIIAAKGWRP